MRDLGIQPRSRNSGKSRISGAIYRFRCDLGIQARSGNSGRNKGFRGNLGILAGSRDSGEIQSFDQESSPKLWGSFTWVV